MPNSTENRDMVAQKLRKKNLQMGLTLAAIVAVFFVGFMARMIILGR